MEGLFVERPYDPFRDQAGWMVNRFGFLLVGFGLKKGCFFLLVFRSVIF